MLPREVWWGLAASREKEWPEAKAEKPGAVRKPGEEGELVS